MLRLAAIAAAFAAVGCLSVGPYPYSGPKEQPPLRVDVGETLVEICDARPKAEKRYFTGAIAFHHPNHISPGLWNRMLDETSAIAKELPESPQRIVVTVDRLRLVQFSQLKLDQEQEAIQKMLDNKDEEPSPFPGQPTPPEKVESLGESIMSGLFEFMFVKPVQYLSVELLVGTTPQSRYPRDMVDLADGITCEIRGTATVVAANGSSRTVPVYVITGGDQPHEAGYVGEAMNDAARRGVMLYGSKLRGELGLASK